MNSLLLVPDGETPRNIERISIKRLYAIYKEANSYGLVSLQFLLDLNLFFGEIIQLSNNTRAELYENLTAETVKFNRW